MVTVSSPLMSSNVESDFNATAVMQSRNHEAGIFRCGLIRTLMIVIFVCTLAIIVLLAILITTYTMEIKTKCPSTCNSFMSGKGFQSLIDFFHMLNQIASLTA
ncbi:unnamed protein product [Rotaria magnacalcarata]